MPVIRALVWRAIIALLAGCGVRLGEHPTTLRPGHTPNRLFAIGQKSYWVARGADSTLVPVADTMMILAPDSLSDTVDFSGGQGCCNGNRLVVTRSAGMLDIRVTNAWHRDEPAVGGLLLHAADWRQTIPLHDQGQWRDSLTIRRLSGADSLIQFVTRHGTAVEWVTYAGGRWLRMRDTSDVVVAGRTTIEKGLSVAGTPVTFRLTGPLAEEFLYEPTSGLVDSIRVHGLLGGHVDFHETTGQVSGVDGVLRVERRGQWEYYAQLRPENIVFAETPARFVAMLEQPIVGDSALVEEAFHLRKQASSPAVRWPLDRLIRFLGYRETRRLVFERAEQQYRTGDAVLRDQILEYEQYGSRTSPLPGHVVESIAAEVQSLAAERRGQLEREAFVEDMSTALHQPGGVEGDGEPGARVAETTDDRHARDLLLLAAYESNPAKYLPLLEQLADTRPGSYGFIARAYAAGNITDAFYLNPSGYDVTWTGRSFPGVDRPWREHVIYFENLPEGAALERARAGSNEPRCTWLNMRNPEFPEYAVMTGAVRLHLQAQGIDAREAFRQRFNAEPDSIGRLVWAHYLLGLGDSTPRPWLRAVYQSRHGELSADAYRLLELHKTLVADTLSPSAVVASLQDAVLECLTGGTPLADTTGHREVSCGRQGEHLPSFLQSDGLAPSVIEKWRGKFELHSRADFIKRARNGARLVADYAMALSLSPVRKIENRYYIDYAFSPGSGESCLCGNGGSFMLEQRNGNWIVVQSGAWIS